LCQQSKQAQIFLNFPVKIHSHVVAQGASMICIWPIKLKVQEEKGVDRVSMMQSGLGPPCIFQHDFFQGFLERVMSHAQQIKHKQDEQVLQIICCF